MRLFFMIALTAFLVSVSAQANTQDNKSTADWITEIGVMKITGEAAESLYDSLIAKEKLHPLSTSFDKTLIKENKFAKCTASFFKTESDEDIIWHLTEAECDIKAPRRTVNTGGEDTL